MEIFVQFFLLLLDEFIFFKEYLFKCVMVILKWSEIVSKFRRVNIKRGENVYSYNYYQLFVVNDYFFFIILIGIYMYKFEENI